MRIINIETDLKLNPAKKYGGFLDTWSNRKTASLQLYPEDAGMSTSQFDLDELEAAQHEIEITFPKTKRGWREFVTFIKQIPQFNWDSLDYAFEGHGFFDFEKKVKAI